MSSSASWATEPLLDRQVEVLETPILEQLVNADPTGEATARLRLNEPLNMLEQILHDALSDEFEKPEDKPEVADEK